VFDTKTVEVTHYVDVSVNRTHINTVEECITESTTTTLHFTVSVTETAVANITVADVDSVTVTNTATNSTTIINTETDFTTVTNTDTDSVTITDTETTTATVPTTTYTTRTIFSTTFDPCPSSCSISAATVNLYFWPTDRPYAYPSTYVDAELDYTFTSPSVYMLIPTAVGINTEGQRTGPSTSRWILPLDLPEVSTIAPAPGGGNVTRQLTLSDLGTDCPQTAEPTAIATMVDARCDPVLAAPSQVRSWAYPCNACGRFGLFDPPYAIPTLTGGLVEPSSSLPPLPPPPPPPPTPTTTVVAQPTSSTPVVTDTPVSSTSTGVQDPGDTTSLVGGTTVTGAPTSTVTAAAARFRVGEGVGTWLIPVSSIVAALFLL